MQRSHRFAFYHHALPSRAQPPCRGILVQVSKCKSLLDTFWLFFVWKTNSGFRESSLHSKMTKFKFFTVSCLLPFRLQTTQSTSGHVRWWSERFSQSHSTNICQRCSADDFQLTEASTEEHDRNWTTCLARLQDGKNKPWRLLQSIFSLSSVFSLFSYLVPKLIASSFSPFSLLQVRSQSDQPDNWAGHTRWESLPSLPSVSHSLPRKPLHLTARRVGPILQGILAQASSANGHTRKSWHLASPQKSKGNGMLFLAETDLSGMLRRY